MIRRYVSGRQVGRPLSSRAWRCTIDAPAATQRSVSSAISRGVMGTLGLSAFVGTIPVTQAFTTSLLPPTADESRGRACGPI